MLYDFSKKVYERMKGLLFLFFNFKVFPRSSKFFGIPKVINRKKLFLQENIRFNPGVFIHCDGEVYIGENVTLSYGVTILSTGYRTDNWSSNKFDKIHVSETVRIQSNCWLGANVIILPGVTVAEGIIVAAGAVVTQDLSRTNALYAGVPARFIKDLL